MTHLPDELRLAILIAINAFVFFASYRFVRRATAQDGIGASLDALLLDYVVQYLAVCLPGLIRILNADTMILTAAALAALLLMGSRWIKDKSPPNPMKQTPFAARFDRLFAIACVLFVLGYFAALIYQQSGAPVLGDDALTYHLPAAATWLQTGRIGLYNTWFFNPANTYSPLAGSVFITWLLAPLQCDIAAHYVQMPALILAMLAIIRIARALQVRIPVASLAATAALCSRPFISESILVKDDVFLAAFFLAAIAGCSSDRLKDRLGPGRIGAGIGLFFATKYTALLTAPLLLLAIDAPFRAGWRARHWLVAAAVAILLAGPWYLRNVILTGNPLYPVSFVVGGHMILKGLFVPIRSTEMRTIHGVWNTITGMYFSISPDLMILLGIGWVIAWLVAGRRLVRSPLARICLLGPPIGIAIFLFISHVNEIRYAYPSLFLLFTCCALAAGRLPIPATAKTILAALLAVVSIWGGFNWKEMLLECFVTCGLVAAAAGLIAIVFIIPMARRDRRLRIFLWVMAALPVVCLIYIYWPGFMFAYRRDYITGFGGFENDGPYAKYASLWKAVDDKLGRGGELAYTNLIFTRPLMGFDYSRRLFYIPIRPGIENYHDLPPGDQHVTDQQIRSLVAGMLTQNPDRTMWLNHLLATGAQYLLVGKQPDLLDPPEYAFAHDDPRHFKLIYENGSGTLFQIIK